MKYDAKINVVRESLYRLTGDTVEALLLNQLIYWQVRRKDVYQYVKEELKEQGSRGNLNQENIDSQYDDGWIYKKATELAKESMVSGSHPKIIRKLEKLIEKGYIARRKNPHFKWDKTYQYRVNLKFIVDELERNGYSPYDLFPVGSSYREIISCIKQSVDHRNVYTEELFVEAIPEVTKQRVPDVAKVNKGGSDFKVVCSEYFKLFEEATSGRKPTMGKATGSQIKRLLSIHGVDNVLINLRKYFNHDFWFTKNCSRDFLSFVKHYDEIQTAQFGVGSSNLSDDQIFDDYNNYMNGG